MYELICVASIFRRRMWRGQVGLAPVPRMEQRFCCRLSDDFEGAAVSRALARLVPDVEAWLTASNADLVNDVVVTVYSIEVADAPVLDDSGV